MLNPLAAYIIIIAFTPFILKQKLLEDLAIGSAFLSIGMHDMLLSH